MTAENYSRAVSDIKFLANRFGGVLKVIDKIDELAEIENLIEERQQSHAALVTAQEHAITDHTAQLEAITAKHQAERKSILDSARVEADKMLKAVQELIFKVDEFANKEKSKLESDIVLVRSDLATQRSNLVRIQSEVRQEQVMADGLRQEQNSLKQQISDLQSERRQVIESIRALQ